MATPKPASTRPRGVRRMFAVLLVAVLLVIATVASFFYLQRVAAQNDAWEGRRQELREEIKRLTDISRATTEGIEPDFRALTDLQEGFATLFGSFKTGDEEVGMPPLPAEYQADIDALAQVWGENQETITAILKNAEVFQRTSTNVAQILDAIVTARQAYEGLPPSLPSAMQLLRLERIATAARSLTALGTNVGAATNALSTLKRDFFATHRTITAEPLRQAATDIELIGTSSDQIVADTEALSVYGQASGGFLGAATNIITAANALDQDVLDARVSRHLDPRIVYALGAAAVVFLVLFLFLFFGSQRRQVRDALERDARQQKAILELLDEITNLADGDLTVDVTVTEDFTGAIADSINYTVASMRSLVGTINDTALEIATAASNTADTARKMNQASERQAKEVTNVTNAIVASSQQLQQVASRAESLAADAQRSVQVAHNGAETVNRTIQNMLNLREQIQDTAKRIKRLGESSQEIGNIIEFINDIAEQTNTLALNASIQAAMAGEQGRGFAVVADEVQRLAERAANATKQIENLVKTIQADTNEAIVSMERSTANVVAGAKSAEEAGQALNQIEGSSTDLARLIQEISGSARAQSAAASKIAGTMQVIRDIAVQTSGSAAQTADAVGNLSALSEKLRQSVAGFKLPEQQAA
ncbi:MAG TPA: methyl-accepting chemotaxis protein [Candidatus Binatia bacterium]|nr:methyl-accepting chemotaxis protein [Candidatus Binatia bacterium]